MVKYHHAQFAGYKIAVSIGFLALLAVILFSNEPFAGGWGRLCVAGLVFFAAVPLLSFRMTIDVVDREVRWAMTVGWPRGRFSVDDIVTMELVSLPQVAGRLVISPTKTFWSTKPIDCVKIELRGSAVPVILGTDDPDGLVTAINVARTR